MYSGCFHLLYFLKNLWYLPPFHFDVFLSLLCSYISIFYRNINGFIIVTLFLHVYIPTFKIVILEDEISLFSQDHVSQNGLS